MSRSAWIAVLQSSQVLSGLLLAILDIFSFVFCCSAFHRYSKAYVRILRGVEIGYFPISTTNCSLSHGFSYRGSKEV